MDFFWNGKKASAYKYGNWTELSLSKKIGSSHITLEKRFWHIRTVVDHDMVVVAMEFLQNTQGLKICYFPP